jgi:3-deoxy-D-manno-octulosonic acid (KDO) 8-phosphate synthase
MSLIKKADQHRTAVRITKAQVCQSRDLPFIFEGSFDHAHCFNLH